MSSFSGPTASRTHTCSISRTHYQNNAPFGKQSGTSWALGITVPLPIYNRNQGNIERARINVDQSQIAVERTWSGGSITEVQQAVNEYAVSGQIVRRHPRPGHARARSELRDDQLRALSRKGSRRKFVFLDAQRKYNDTVKAYLDAAVRHRRSMLS